MDSDTQLVLVTGFGPFRQYVMNPSWAAVQGLAARRHPTWVAFLHVSAGDSGRLFDHARHHSLSSTFASLDELKKLGVGENVGLVTLELPVHYQRARELLTRLWETQEPQLAVHVGVATGSKVIVLEQCARNRGYTDCDVGGCCPPGNCCVEGGPDTLESLVNMRAICKRLSGRDIGIIHSRDAGRYLCDYVYYVSLHHGNRKAGFIHVPPPSSGPTVASLGKALQLIVREMLADLETAPH